MGSGKRDDSDAQFGIHPPLPRLTLRVGITGHRPKLEKLPPESYDFVKKRLREVFACVDTALAEVLASQRDCFDGSPVVRLASGVAEGADQFAVEVMPPSWNLDAVLPFPRAEYIEDFGTRPGPDGKSAREKYEACLARSDATVTELPSVGRQGEVALQHHTDAESIAGYARLGGFLLRQVDILIAVWDGKAGEKGGTGEVVRAATGGAIPVVRINSLNDTPGRMVKGVDSEGNAIEWEDDCCGGQLREAIDAIVGFPKKSPPVVVEEGGLLHRIIAFLRELLRRGCRSRPARDSKDVPDRLQDYRTETWPLPFFSIYDAFKRRVGRESFRRDFTEAAEGYRERWAPALQDDLAAVQLRGQLEKLLLPRYVWADALALAYSHRYRSAYINCYLLAALTVAIALIGIILHEKLHDDVFLHAKAALVFVELCLIMKIMCIVSRGWDERWKEKWMEYRSLAELLFNMRFLSYLAEHGRTQRISKRDTSSEAWVLWYLGATIREVGLPNAVLNEAYQSAALGALDAYVVKHQHEWHVKTAGTLGKMHNWLQWRGEICFGLTMFLLALFLVLYPFAFLPGAEGLKGILENQYALWLTFVAAFLPALGAAFASIRTTGDFDIVAERSRKTAAALTALASEIADVRKSPTLDQTGDVLLRAASILAEDLDSWHLVYGDKRLELPS